MTTVDQVEQRLAAVERTVVDGDHNLDTLSDAAAVVSRLENLESKIEGLEQRIAAVEGRSESIESYVGHIDTVNKTVEQRSDMAIASVDRLEQRLVEIEQTMEISMIQQIDHRITEIEDEVAQLSTQDTTEGNTEFEGLSFGETDEIEQEQSAEHASDTAVEDHRSVRQAKTQSIANESNNPSEITTEESRDQQEQQSSETETEESSETEGKKSLKEKIKAWK